MSLAQRTQALADASCYWPTLMFPFRCTHTTANSCTPWLMLPVVGQRCLIKVNISWVMFPDFDRCKYLSTDAQSHNECLQALCLQLADMYILMCASYKRCWQAMYDVWGLMTVGYGLCWKTIEYRFYPRLTLLNSCVHANGDAGILSKMRTDHYV